MNSKPETCGEASAIMFDRYAAVISLAKASGYVDPFEADDRLNLDNLLWMCTEASQSANDIPEDKISRWLGFVQGCLAMRRMIDVDAERDFSRAIFGAVHTTNGIALCSLERPEP